MSSIPAGIAMDDAAIAINKVFSDKSVKTGSRKTWLFVIALVFLLIPGLVHAYLLMPFPGSQNLEAITLCYYLEKIIWPLRIVGILLMITYGFYFGAETQVTKYMLITFLLVGGASYYITDIKFKADEMFKEPVTPNFANTFKNKVPMDFLVVGIVHNGIAKAYPIVYLGYHHKVQDEVGGMPVMVTYCTMCRTGRVFSPVIDGKRETFGLVGARHYNAVIKDASTQTWWYQATGEAAVGRRKGQKLAEIPYQQATLSAWLERYPTSLILQPEVASRSEYAELKKYDITQPIDRDSTIINKDSLLRKSWVLGLVVNNRAKAYNWRKLVTSTLINDRIGGTPVMLNIEKDKQSFNVWKSVVSGKELTFKTSANGFIDNQSLSEWNKAGSCISGIYKGSKLIRLQAYQEYWHSWKTFHPETEYTAIF